ncbi:MAG: DUF3108 domain-containing protein [Leptothrix ochracea]|uniref:DUF3108 domain-containing protein n=1 Tax=Leptothrix ochracea TaxID=735331 RepID=UPI0034E2D7C0
MSRWGGRRAGLLLALLVGVIGLHIGGLGEISAQLDAARFATAPKPAMQRMQATYARSVLPTAAPAPVAHAPAPLAKKKRHPAPEVALAAAAAAAASAASEPASAVPVEVAASAEETLAVAASAPEVASSSVSVAEAPPASTPVFTWPVSTKISYTLLGNYRGPVEGQAQVEWLRQGARYQVHLDVSIGPPFAPLASRRVSSQGLIDATGLVPQLYEQETRVLMGGPRLATIRFEPDGITLANGRHEAPKAEIQDTASQFIQLVYLFTTHAELHTEGAQVALPLALPHRVDRWVYDVGGAEPQETSVGVIEALHLKPRRLADPGDITVEMWLAPTLHWFPVHIRMRQDTETYLDLILAKWPEQSGP